MPAAHRGGSAYAQIDGQLAEWLTTEGHSVSASRVAGWRAAGLLPVPTSRARGGGCGPGRVAVAWTAAEWADVQTIGLRLVDATGRGRSTTAAVLRLAGDGVPVPPLTVLAAAHEHVALLDRDVRAQLGVRGLRLAANADRDLRPMSSTPSCAAIPVSRGRSLAA